MAKRTRTHDFTLRLSDEEFAILNGKWKLSGMHSRSSYIRQLILYGLVYNIDYSDLQKYNEQLARIGNNLNQIAHQANANAYATNNDLALARRYMEQIWHTHKSMLSKLPLVKQ